MSQPKIALLTNCTSSSNFAPLVRIEDAPEVQTMDELCLWWVEQMKVVEDEQPEAMRTPGELYDGESFSMVTEIAQIIGHSNIYVVNRGGGLVRHDVKMVPYNFMYGRHDAGGAFQKVKGEKFLPALWWGKVNEALHGDSAPITNLKTEDGEDYDYIITALPKGFIRLISKDLSGVQQAKQRLFMPLPQSGVSNVPRGLRPSCVPYTPTYTEDITYNRFTKAHCVALKFLEAGLAEGNLMKHANALRDSCHALDPDSYHGDIVYEDLFEEHPELLAAPTAEAAVVRAKMEGIRVGSVIQFGGAWRGAQGQQELEIEKEELGVAQESLKTMLVKMQNKMPVSNEVLLEKIGVFVAAVQSVDPDLIFTHKEVALWGQQAYGKEAKRSGISSGSKISRMLRTYTTYLGLELIPIGSNKAYRIKKEEE